MTEIKVGDRLNVYQLTEKTREFKQQPFIGKIHSSNNIVTGFWLMGHRSIYPVPASIIPVRKARLVATFIIKSLK